MKNHINSCITCSKNLPNTANHPQLHLEIPKVPFACIAIDTIGKLPTATSGNKYALTCIDQLTSYIIAVPIPNKTAESVVVAYLSGILSRTGASMVCLSDNGSELKNNQMNTVLKQLGIICIFTYPYMPQGNSHIENGHDFLKRMLIFYIAQMQNGIRSYHLPATASIQPLQLTTWKAHFFLVHGRDPLEGCTGLLGKGSIRYLGDDKGLILFAEIHKLWSAHAKALKENRKLKTEKVEKNKHFKAHDFKVGQLIAVKNHLRNTFESRFILDYRVLKIVNELTLLVESPDDKTRQININDAKPVSATAAINNALHDFKLSAMKREHTHPYML